MTHRVTPNQALLLQGQVEGRLWNGVRNSTSEKVEQIGYAGPKSKIRDAHALSKEGQRKSDAESQQPRDC